MDKTYGHKAPNVRPVNGWIYAESEITTKKATIAKSHADADLIQKTGEVVVFTGRMKALAVSKEAEKAHGLKPGMYFYPSHYQPVSPEDENRNRNERYFFRSFLSEADYAELDKAFLVPPTCDVHMDSIAYIDENR